MTTTISTQAAAPSSPTSAALRSNLQQTANALVNQFSATLAEAIDSALRPATTTPTAATAATPLPLASAETATAGTAASAATQTPKAAWLPGPDTARQYLHEATADHATRYDEKPDTATFMKATGCDLPTASSLLYGVIGSNAEFRNWGAIMSSPDPVQAARQATGAMYGSDLPYTHNQGLHPTQSQTVAAAGNYSWLNVEGREGLWLMDNQGQALRQLPLSAPDILRASRDFGMDTANLAHLADQLDAQGVAYAGNVDLRGLARGTAGAAYDWTSDPQVALKGPGAQDSLQANAQLARELGLIPTTSATTTGTPGTAAPQAATLLPASNVPNLQTLGKQLTDTLLAQLQNALKG